MTRRPHRPSARAIEAAQAWQAPAGPTLEWTANEVIERNRFGDEIIRLRIAADGRVGRWLPHCRTHLNIVGDDFQPLRAEPLASESDAHRLLARVRALSEPP